MPLFDLLRLRYSGTAKTDCGAKKVAKHAPYSADYFGLRVKDGELPAVRERGRWMTLQRAVELYREHVGRK